MDREIIYMYGSKLAKPVTSTQMKEIERNADAAGLSYERMMENAGSRAAEIIMREHHVEGKSIFIFCGKGNNGGDGFVAARKLAESGAAVRLILVEGEPKTADAIKNRKICEEMDIPAADPAQSHDIEAADLIVDAIYGTGFHGEIREPARTAVRLINASKAQVYALDIPSGLNGDTGEAGTDTVRADCTIVFHRLKPAHALADSAAYCGRIICISIGIESVLNGNG